MKWCFNIGFLIALCAAFACTMRNGDHRARKPNPDATQDHRPHQGSTNADPDKSPSPAGTNNPSNPSNDAVPLARFDEVSESETGCFSYRQNDTYVQGTRVFKLYYGCALLETEPRKKTFVRRSIPESDPKRLIRVGGKYLLAFGTYDDKIERLYVTSDLGSDLWQKVPLDSRTPRLLLKWRIIGGTKATLQEPLFYSTDTRGLYRFNSSTNTLELIIADLLESESYWSYWPDSATAFIVIPQSVALSGSVAVRGLDTTAMAAFSQTLSSYAKWSIRAFSCNAVSFCRR